MGEKNLIIYHAACPDGFTAAWAAQLHLPGDCELFPGYYGADPPDVTDRDVWIVDFSYKREVLLRLHSEARSLRVLDHHKTAEAELEGLDFCTFDMERSGAGITWDELSGGQKRPWLIDYMEDRDLWRWALPDSKAVAAYVMAHPYDLDTWDELCGSDLSGAVRGGQAVMMKINAYCHAMEANVYRRNFGGRENVPIVNAPQVMISDLLHHIAERNDGFAVGWWFRQDGLYQYSLRSIGDFDVSEIATAHGGGGHKNAAGFTAITRGL
jgi:oligoribonuclease NrnB/cAMP/cGMP phosphodiesterase (DHH superfamily)